MRRNPIAVGVVDIAFRRDDDRDGAHIAIVEAIAVARHTLPLVVYSGDRSINGVVGDIRLGWFRELSFVAVPADLGGQAISVGIDTGGNFAAVLCGYDRQGHGHFIADHYAEGHNLFDNCDAIKTMCVDALGELAGVPMGGDLVGGNAETAPVFFLWALSDPASARLQRLQVIKGWIDAAGRTQERVFDVACSDGLEVDEATHRCPDNGARVNLTDCSISRNVGAAELETFWEDPEFDAGQMAFYYVRALENPTCRWSTWDAVRAGVEPRVDLQATIQERVWSSPIWYVPGGAG